MQKINVLKNFKFFCDTINYCKPNLFINLPNSPKLLLLLISSSISSLINSERHNENGNVYIRLQKDTILIKKNFSCEQNSSTVYFNLCQFTINTTENFFLRFRSRMLFCIEINLHRNCLSAEF